LHRKRQTGLVVLVGVVLSACSQSGGSSIPATSPNTSGWVRHDMPNMGLGILMPPDWHRLVLADAEKLDRFAVARDDPDLRSMLSGFTRTLGIEGGAIGNTGLAAVDTTTGSWVLVRLGDPVPAGDTIVSWLDARTDGSVEAIGASIGPVARVIIGGRQADRGRSDILYFVDLGPDHVLQVNVDPAPGTDIGALAELADAMIATIERSGSAPAEDGQAAALAERLPAKLGGRPLERSSTTGRELQGGGDGFDEEMLMERIGGWNGTSERVLDSVIAMLTTDPGDVSVAIATGPDDSINLLAIRVAGATHPSGKHRSWKCRPDCSAITSLAGLSSLGT
jgi:hypothetical protein